MKKGELVSYGVYRAICLGSERIREDFNEEGSGGLFVPQIRIVIVKSRPRPTGVFRELGLHHVGKQIWADRKLVKRIELE